MRQFSTLLILAACAGCASMRASSDYTPTAQFPASSMPMQESAADPGAAATAANGRLAAAEGGMASVMAELQQLGESNPRAQQMLLEELRRTDLSLWQQQIRVFRSSLAYAEQAAARDRLAQAASDVTAPLTQPVPVERVQAQMQPVGYPRTDYPPVDLSLSQLDLRRLPAAGDGALLDRSVAPEPIAAYPSTHLNESRFNDAREPREAESYSGAPQTAAISDALPVSQDPPDGLSQLQAAIATLRAETGAAANTALDFEDQVRLRLLHLAAGQRDEALQPLSGLSGAEQEFWNAELFGLAALIDPSAEPDKAQRAADAADYLRQAAEKLARTGPLAVRNLAFCTEVNSYGVYMQFPQYQFKSGQEILLYAEIDNFTSNLTDKGFHTALASKYEILDGQGTVVAQQDLPATEEHCRNARRDFFIRYFLSMPAKLAPGEYTLRLTIEDVKGGNQGQGEIRFAVAGAR